LQVQRPERLIATANVDNPPTDRLLPTKPFAVDALARRTRVALKRPSRAVIYRQALLFSVTTLA
jgi:hypothetical protein